MGSVVRGIADCGANRLSWCSAEIKKGSWWLPFLIKDWCGSLQLLQAGHVVSNGFHFIVRHTGSNRCHLHAVGAGTGTETG